MRTWVDLLGVPQVSSQAVQEPEASGEDEQAQDAPAENNDDAHTLVLFESYVPP